MDNDSPRDPAIQDNMNDFENIPFGFNNTYDSPLCVYDDVSSSDTESIGLPTDSEYSSSFIGIPCDSPPVDNQDNLDPIDFQYDLPSVDLPPAFPSVDNQIDSFPLDLQQDLPPLDLQHDLPPLDVPPEVSPEVPHENPPEVSPENLPNNSLMESVSMEIEDENDPIDVENETSSSDNQDSSMDFEYQLPYEEKDIEFTPRYLLPGSHYTEFESASISEQMSYQTEQELAMIEETVQTVEEMLRDPSNPPEIKFPFFNVIVFVTHDVGLIRSFCDELSAIEGEYSYNINCYHLCEVMIVMEHNPCDLCIIQADYVQEVTISYPKVVCAGLYLKDKVVGDLMVFGLEIG